MRTLTPARVIPKYLVTFESIQFIPWLIQRQRWLRWSIVKTRKWLGNLAKFFVVGFCWLFWGLNLHKSWQNTKDVYLLEQLNNRDSCIFYDREHKTKDVPGQEPSNINLSPFVCFLDVSGLPSYLPLLTMNGTTNTNSGFVTCLFRTENTRVRSLTSN